MADIQKLNARFDVALYKRIVSSAKKEEVSLNEWLVSAALEKLDGKVSASASAVAAPLGPIRRAAEIAASIPGVRIGMSNDDDLESDDSPFYVVEETVRRDSAWWIKKIMECKELPGQEAMRELDRACGGVTIPREFYRPGVEQKLAAWLEVNAKASL